MEPVRTCVGCGRKAPRGELARFVARDGSLVHDPSGTEPGRGAYTCRRDSCLERAAAARAFARALRRTVQLPADLQAVWRAG